MSAFTQQSPKTPELVRDMLLAAAGAFGDKPAILAGGKDGYRAYPYRRLRSDIEALGTELMACGLEGKKLLILGDNGYGWVLSVLTALCGSGIAVPLDKTLSAGEVAHLADFTDAAAILYSDRLEAATSLLPDSVRRIPFSSFATLLEQGRGKINSGITDFIRLELDADAPALFAFTSGTAFSPKAAMLSNANLCYDIRQTLMLLCPDSTDSFLSVLPLHHVYELVCGLLLPLSVGASIAYGEGLGSLIRNMNEVHPTTLVTVPVVVEALAAKVREAKRAEGNKKTEVGIVTTNFLPFPAAYAVKKKLFAGIHKLFGGNLSHVVCGGSPVDEQALQTLCDVGILAVEGYGLCECSPVVAVNPIGSFRTGSVGVGLPDSTIDIYNIQEDGTGEIRVKGKNVMLGYYKNPELTAEVIRGEWFYTGDLGCMDEDGFLYITGRKKNVIVKAGGKNVFPEEIETWLNRSPFVRESVVVGFINNKKRDYDLVAVIRPDYEKIIEVYGENYTASDVETEIETAVENVNAGLPAYKQIDMTILRREPFERNRSRKIRRIGVAPSVIEEYRRKLAENEKNP